MPMEEGNKIESSSQLDEKMGVTLIPIMYETALPKGLQVLETSADVFHTLSMLNQGEALPPFLIRPDLIEFFLLNNIRVQLVTRVDGFVDFPFYTKNGQLLKCVSLDDVRGCINEALADNVEQEESEENEDETTRVPTSELQV